VVQEIEACEKIVTSNLATRAQAKLVSQAIDDIWTLAKAHVRYLSLCTSIGLAGQQLSSWVGHAPNLVSISEEKKNKKLAKEIFIERKTGTSNYIPVEMSPKS